MMLNYIVMIYSSAHTGSVMSSFSANMWKEFHSTAHISLSKIIGCSGPSRRPSILARHALTRTKKVTNKIESAGIQNSAVWPCDIYPLEYFARVWTLEVSKYLASGRCIGLYLICLHMMITGKTVDRITQRHRPPRLYPYPL